MSHFVVLGLLLVKTNDYDGVLFKTLAHDIPVTMDSLYHIVALFNQSAETQSSLNLS